MFDIGFSELMLIALVALIVIGPERLPRVARTVGHLIGRLQRYVADVKADISREVDLDEFRNMRDSVKEAASSIETSISSGMSKTEDELRSSLSLDEPEEEDESEPGKESQTEDDQLKEAAAVTRESAGPEHGVANPADRKAVEGKP